MGRGAEGGRRTGTRVASALAGCILFLSLGACTFERRADPGEAGISALTTEDSIRAVVASLDAARRDGDLAAALGLFDTDARVSPLIPPGSESTEGPWRSPGDALAEEWTPGAPVLRLDLLESRVEFPGTGTALVLNRYADEGTPTREAVALETMVLVRLGGEWRIRHLHRSFPLPTGARP